MIFYVQITFYNEFQMMQNSIDIERSTFDFFDISEVTKGTLPHFEAPIY